MDIKDLLQFVVDRNASDLHMLAGSPPVLRAEGELVSIQNAGVLTPEVVYEYLSQVLSAELLERLKVNKEIDFSLSFSDKARFRVNAYTQKGSYAAAFRKIPLTIP